MMSGRPETTTTAHFRVAAQTLSTAALSAVESCMSLTGRGIPLSPGSLDQRGPKTSPKPSAYGVSPTTTMPTEFRRIGNEASSL
jgi:hypothetical protein